MEIDRDLRVNKDSIRDVMLKLLLITAVLAPFLLACAGCSKSQNGSAPASGSEAQVAAQDQALTVAPTDKSRIMAEGVKNAKLVLETRDGADVLNVVVLDKTRDSESIRYDYEWTKNGEPAGKGTSVSGFKRGDKLSVKIAPVDGEKLGKSKTLTTEIKNSTPKIIELKNVAGDEKQVSYQVVAKDADGDPLTYSLLDGAKGMTIDSKSGMLQWSIDPAAPQADITVTVKVADGQGGEVTYPLKVQQQEKPVKK